MGCTKCIEKFELSQKESKIFFVSEFEELVRKSRMFIMDMGFDVLKLHDLNYIVVPNPKLFFETHLETIKEHYNELELADIKLYIIGISDGFNYQALLGAKSLQRYINLIDDKEFFDIVNNESLTSYFQPIVDIHANEIYGYEALIRGVKEDGSLMYPDILFEKSKRNDLNFKLDRLCRESALKTAAVKKIQQKVFINFIPTSIYDPEFCLNSTVKWANQLEFNPKNIVFEVVETEHVKDQAHLKKILTYYREQGYQIALDDVGEGFSNLNMLIDLKPDIIKVDRNIIDHIDKDDMKLSVYKALYDIASSSGIKILAEGLERVEELEAIKSIGVDYVQGYYYAKPQAEPVRKLLV
ncbi:MAG: EAL domain-containing protein [Sulfurimonadaceae bacterium]|jgi:EAL domain-containing protein (putative c-di-GMP-specific phosphodiesterase class I)|nr:EAL domain-containing protein [Sulfurimonadaceae bacterium]